MKVEIYSDVVCPWCYIGERRFERALDEFARGDEVEVVHRSYQLDPGAPSTAVPLKEYLARRFGLSAGEMLRRVNDAAIGEGILINWDDALSVSTATAHRLLGLAEREYGARVQRELAKELFALHFEHGGDLSDHEALAALADSVGMDGDRARAYLGSGEGVREVESEFRAARELGIQSVPTFVFEGMYAVQGAHPTSTFLQLLEKLDAELRPTVSPEEDVDSCEDGAY